MAVTNIPPDLEAKLRTLNTARDRTLVGSALAAPAALNTARAGGDTMGVVSQYLPKGRPPADPLAIAKMKKDIIIEMAKDQEDLRAGKLSLAAAFQKGNDLVEKILGTAGQFGAAQASAFASVKNNVRDNITKAGSDTADAVVKALGTVDEGSSVAVSRALESLRGMMAPGGVVGPEFSAGLSQQLTTLPDARSRAYLMEALNQVPEVQSQGGLRQVLSGMGAAGDQPAANALTVWTQNQQFVDEATQRVANLPMAIWASTIEQMSSEGTLGEGTLGRNIEEITATLRELGLAQDPAERERIFDKLVGSLRPDGSNPDAQKRFDELLGQLDKPVEQLDPTRRQAKADLMNSEGFKSWMNANGFKDPDMALKALRQRWRTQTGENEQADRRLMKESRGKPQDMVLSPSSTLTQKGSPSPKAPDSIGLEPGVVMGPDGAPVLFTGTELVPLDEAALDELDAKWSSNPAARQAYTATRGRYKEYEAATAKATVPQMQGAPEMGLATPMKPPAPEAPKAPAPPELSLAAPPEAPDMQAEVSKRALSGLFAKGKDKKEEERRKKLEAGLAP